MNIKDLWNQEFERMAGELEDLGMRYDLSRDVAYTFRDEIDERVADRVAAQIDAARDRMKDEDLRR